MVQVFQNADKKVGLYQKKLKSCTDISERALADQWAYDDILRQTAEHQMHLKSTFYCNFF